MFGIKTWLKWCYFDHICTPLNNRRISRKERIKVLFILTELSIWKTETLYQKMLNHPRFVPIIGVTPTTADKEEARERIRNYCKQNNYNYINIDTEQTLVEQSQADIILYAEPYQYIYWPKHRITKNLKALFAYVPYSMHSVLEDWSVNEQLFLHAWQYYFENETTAKEYARRMKNNGENLVVTGLPIMDQLMNMGNEGANPWKNKIQKKRIIYAPHHTIGNLHFKGIGYSTFLEYADFMVEMAIKYKDLIHIAFKPHPYLRNRLYSVWSEQKTEAYYRKWEEMENTQLESGKYMSLFHYSDAMIHDCGSFTLEYLYTKNPVMYLVKDNHHTDNVTQFATDAFDLHYHGHNKEQIEQFIIDVINSKDPMKEKRNAFYCDNLIPIGNNTACDNIIEAILTRLEEKKN